jgi:hypothetical protein
MTTLLTLGGLALLIASALIVAICRIAKDPEHD